MSVMTTPPTRSTPFWKSCSEEPSSAGRRAERGEDGGKSQDEHERGRDARAGSRRVGALAHDDAEIRREQRHDAGREERRDAGAEQRNELSRHPAPLRPRT